MKRTVWKFPIVDDARVEMPEGAKAVHIGFQGRQLTMWAEIDPSAPLTHRSFEIVGTGHDIPDGGQHVYSWIDEPFVWHLYEVGK